MALRLSAVNAEEVAAGFTTFRDPLPEHAAEVTSLIADLYSISSLFASLDALYLDIRYRRNFSLIQPDLELVRISLKYTLEDIFGFFRSLDGGKSSPAHYKRTWKNIHEFFWNESHYSLATRLAKFRTMLRELTELARDGYQDSPILPGLRNGMKSLLAVQERRIAQQLERMSLNRSPSSSGNAAEPPSPVDDRKTSRRRSYERTRPAHLSPTSPLSPSSGVFSDIPTSISDTPGSPMTSTTATTATSFSNTSDSIKEHWAKSVFNTAGSHPLPRSPHKSRCEGNNHVGIKQQLKEMEFEELLQLSLEEESDMRISFYLRKRDHRVRILCKIPHHTRPSEYFCLPLNLLEAVRDGPFLRLCRRRNKGTVLILWALLKFTSMEDLVIFHNTFLALRSQDSGHPVDGFIDYELDGEEELYGGVITDDGYGHALRVYEDVESGAVRLQASVHEGEMTRTPVWTAFITHNIGRRNWIKSIDPQTVIMRNLKPVVYMSTEDYNPQQTTQGYHILKFETSRDANEFLDAMNELAETIR
ncbi:uncharacterized protein N7529_009023 [Penicillium soppii]|uniref:uncharacterized protein n=1 Tax=Penicillium soppii TaxID=69789 RepID=UPI00254937C7|nr:uncharacterized protein N7529_009023 [Penicillium soppii]KAJ5861713.1 hypothetical protein N7529_009023 [Penicillium soppii]